MNPTLQVSTFDQWVDRYLRRQRSLGRAYVHEEHVIGALRRFLEKNSCTDLDQAIFEAWCASQSHLSANTRRNRQRIVRNFRLYRQRSEPTCFVPDINRLSHRSPYAPPVIFRAAEVARMLAMADRSWKAHFAQGGDIIRFPEGHFFIDKLSQRVLAHVIELLCNVVVSPKFHPTDSQASVDTKRMTFPMGTRRS
jgi:hypothetical protein